MKKWLLLGIPVVTVAVACSSSTTTPAADGGTPAADAGPTPTGTTTSTGTTVVDAAVPLPPPATFPLTSGTCVETPPCGGALEGTWDYIAGCVSDADLADLEREIQKGCPSASLDKVSGSMSGRVIFAGKTVVRKATISINADVSIPKVCADQAGGNCSFVAVAIKSAGGAQVKAATCANVADGCACKLETAVAADKSGTTFTTTGNTLLTSDGDEYSFCVAAGKLTHKQTKPGNPALVEPGAYEATKR